MKKITIIVPSYNHSKYLPNLLESITMLEGLCDVIIIDDASTDDSGQIITNYALKHENVKAIIKTENKGLVDSLQRAVSAVKTEYLYMIASDDKIDVNNFPSALDYILDNENLYFSIFNSTIINESGKNIKSAYTDHHKNFFSLPCKEIKDKIFYDHPSPILLQSTIFKTSLFKEFHLLDSKLKFDDYPIFIKLLSSKLSVNTDYQFFPSINISYYRHHETNTFLDYRKMYNMFQEVYNNLASGLMKRKSISYIWLTYLLRSGRELRVRDFCYFLFLKFNFWGVLYSFSFLLSKLKK